MSSTNIREPFHKKILLFLLIAAAGLIAVHLILQFRLYVLEKPSVLVLGGSDIDLTFWFDLNVEKHFGAIFGTFLILFASCNMAFAAYRVWPQRAKTLGWVLMSGVLMFMAFDEFLSLHERAGSVAGLETEGYGTRVLPIWVQAMAVVVAILCIPMGIFWWKTMKGLRVRTLISVAVYLGGAMGIEIVSSAFVMHQGAANYGYIMLVALEEGMEMLGMIICIDVMLLYLTHFASKKTTEDNLLLQNGAIPKIA